MTVVGVWQRGSFELALPDVLIQDNTVLLLDGSQEALERYNDLFRTYNVSAAPVVILGGGQVGRATARALAKLLPERIRDGDGDKYVLGDAADLHVLKRAGILEAPTVIVTTHDDDLNVYLAIYCRRLRPDIQIIA